MAVHNFINVHNIRKGIIIIIADSIQSCIKTLDISIFFNTVTVIQSWK